MASPARPLERWGPVRMISVWMLLYFATATADSNDTGITSPSSPSLSSPTTAVPSPTPTLSGCQVCAVSGDCSHAYLDGPGQFCGNWLDKFSQRQRCCCPRNATCKVSNYECKCSRITTTPRPATRSPNTPTPHTTHASSGSVWSGLAVGFALIAGCCVCAMCCCGRRDASNPTARLFFGGAGPGTYDVLSGPKPGVVYAQPAPGYAPYAVPAMAPAYYPAYASPYGYGHSSGGSALAAGSLGAVAGVATGMMVANSFGHHHSDYHYYGGGGYSGSGGYSGGGGTGGDYGGDSGGDFGGDF